MRVANPGGTKRYFVIFGSFVFPEERENLGIIAIDSDGVIATNAKGILTAQSWCGEKRWQAPWTPNGDGVRRDFDAPDGYDWHHDIVYHDNAFHTFVGPNIASVNAETGAVQRKISVIDVMRWSWRDGLALLDGRNKIFESDSLTSETAADLLVSDPFHFNKVDVLTEELARDYPMFEVGDLLVSVRDLNLVLVLRPGEESILWWRYGLTSRQHDATFIDGAVEVFNNAPFTAPLDQACLRRPTRLRDRFRPVAVENGDAPEGQFRTPW